MIDAVFYDFDGVVVDSEQVHFRCWNAALESVRVALSLTEYANNYSGNSTATIAMMLVNNYQLSVQPKVIATRKERAFSARVAKHGMPLVQSTKESIQILRAADIRLGIVTNSAYGDVETILMHGTVIGAFETIIAREKVDEESPKSESYQAALAAMEVPATRCVVIEDAPVGVQAARASGALAIAVLLCHPRSAFADANLIVERLADLTVEQVTSLVAA